MHAIILTDEESSYLSKLLSDDRDLLDDQQPEDRNDAIYLEYTDNLNNSLRRKFREIKQTRRVAVSIYPQNAEAPTEDVLAEDSDPFRPDNDKIYVATLTDKTRIFIHVNETDKD